jgi:hypothetical protein
MTTFASALLLVSLLVAQQPAPAEKEKKDPAEERRETAVFLLTSLADESAKYDDAVLRARVQARTADMLWPVDRERARSLFRKSWESAGRAYDEAKRRHDEEMRRQREEGRPSVSFGFVDAREEVLRLVATRDRKLADQLFVDLAESREREAANAQNEHRSPYDALSSPPAPIAKRLELATTMLERDDVETALGFADPALATITMPGIEFLTALRAKDAAAADARYIRLLATAVADPASDANTVSLLSSYVFWPHTYYLLSAENTQSMSRGRGENEPEPSADSRSAFLQAAAQIFLRPLTPEQIDATAAGRNGTYLFIGRLLPYYEQYAGHLVEQLRARQTALGLEAQQMDERLRRTFGDNREASGGEQTSRVDALLAQARAAQSAPERDGLYAQAAVAALRYEQERIDDIVGSISDLELRQRTRAYLDFNRAQRAFGDRDYEKTLRFVRKGEMQPIQRVWFLTSIARASTKDDKDRAASLLGEALDAARRIELNDPDRARALFAVASTWIDVDPKLVAERAAEATEAANRVEGFTGEDGVVRSVFTVPGMTMANSESATQFDVAPVFSYLARTDLENAILMARNFEPEAPRAAALLAVARTALETPKKAGTAAKAASARQR